MRLLEMEWKEIQSRKGGRAELGQDRDLGQIPDGDTGYQLQAFMRGIRHEGANILIPGTESINTKHSSLNHHSSDEAKTT